MIDFWGTVKNLVATRGAQFGGRIVLMIAIYIAGKFGAHFSDDTSAQIALMGGTAFVALCYWLIDTWSHKKQTQDVIGKTVDLMVQKLDDRAIAKNERAEVAVIPALQAAREIKADTQILGKLPERATVL
jgi:uncharacterized protein involved in response to NO